MSTTASRPPDEQNGAAPGPAGPLDSEAFVAGAQRITNSSSLDEALALFHEDCVAEWVFDGVCQRLRGIEAITRAMDAMMGINRERKILGRKELICADADTIVNAWHGGFRGDDRQFGTEIWTLRDGLVVRHQMYMYLRVRSADSILGQLRMLLSAPRTALTWFKHEQRATRKPTSAGPGPHR